MVFRKLSVTKKSLAAIGVWGFATVSLPAVAQELVPGETIPGETIPETVPSETVPAVPTDQQPVPDPIFPADPTFPGDFTPEPAAPIAPDESTIPSQPTEQAPTEVAPPEIQILPSQTIGPATEPAEGAPSDQPPSSVQVIPPGGSIIINNPAESSAIVEVIPAQGGSVQLLEGSETVPSLQPVEAQPLGPTFAPAECMQNEVYVNLPQWGGGACLAPGQFENIAR